MLTGQNSDHYLFNLLNNIYLYADIGLVYIKSHHQVDCFIYISPVPHGEEKNEISHEWNCLVWSVLLSEPLECLKHITSNSLPCFDITQSAKNPGNWQKKIILIR